MYFRPPAIACDHRAADPWRGLSCDQRSDADGEQAELEAFCQSGWQLVGNILPVYSGDGIDDEGRCVRKSML